MSTDLVIILSSDWVASTETRARLGEEPADALQTVHDALLRRVIDSHAGTVVKHSGDGVLATFRSATSALAAAVKIREKFAAYSASPEAIARVDVRLGLAAGDVSHQSGDIFGLPVIEAVRLQSAAAPNDVLCSDLVRVLSQGRGGFQFEHAGSLKLKGLPTAVQALRVLAEQPASRPLVGRSARSARRSELTLRTRPLYLAAALLVLALLAGALVDRLVIGGQPRVPIAPELGDTAADSGPRSHAIAVLPFANLSPNEADAYFAVGIHEEILNQLTKLGSLRVVARTSVQRYAQTDKTITEVARELGVETVMDGSVRYADGRVVVSARLVDGSTDSNLWSESYEREFGNIFAIQSDVALSVARALQAELLPEERASVARVPTTSLPAYELYLLATAQYARQTREDVLAGIESADQALALDPSFASAWALKANLESVAQLFDRENNAVHRAPAARAARRALELDPTLGNAHAALGFALSHTTDWIGSEEAFRQALALNVPLGDLMAYAVLRAAVGDFARSREILLETRASAPQNPSVLALLLSAAAMQGDWDTAETQYALGKRLFEPWMVADIFMMHLRVGRNELAAARTIPAYPPVSTVLIGVDTAEAALAELRRMYADPAFADPISHKEIALWAAHYGDTTLTLDAMRSAIMHQGAANLFYVWYPQFAAIRRQPEFRALLRELGVVDYWGRYGWPQGCRPQGNDFACD